MLLKLQKCDLELHYMKGKELHVADAFSCAYLHYVSFSDNNDEEDMEFAVHAMV